jgi:hypothetical protein
MRIRETMQKEIGERMENRNDPPNTGDVSKWDCGSPLYDSFELVSIYSRLDRGLTITTTTDHTRGTRDYNSSFPSKIMSENLNLQCQCEKKRKTHRFSWLFRLALSISRALALWKSKQECPRHRLQSGFASEAHNKMGDHS